MSLVGFSLHSMNEIDGVSGRQLNLIGALVTPSESRQVNPGARLNAASFSLPSFASEPTCVLGVFHIITRIQHFSIYAFFTSKSACSFVDNPYLIWSPMPTLESTTYTTLVHHKIVLPTLCLTIYSLVLYPPKSSLYSLQYLRLAKSPPAPGLVPSARGPNTVLGDGIQHLAPRD